MQNLEQIMRFLNVANLVLPFTSLDNIVEVILKLDSKVITFYQIPCSSQYILFFDFNAFYPFLSSNQKAYILHKINEFRQNLQHHTNEKV